MKISSLLLYNVTSRDLLYSYSVLYSHFQELFLNSLALPLVFLSFKIIFSKLIVSLTLSTTNIDLYSNLRLDSRVLILIVLLGLDVLLRFPILLYK